MLHIQYNGFVFHKFLRDPHGPLIGRITCILFTIGSLFSWYLFISQHEGKLFLGGFAILCSIFNLLVIYKSFTQSIPFMNAQWRCSEQTISTHIDGQSNSIDLYHAYFCTKYDTQYESRIRQVFLIFSTTPFSTNDFRGDIYKAILRGFLKGWVIVSDCEEIHKFLDDNRRTVPDKEYPSISYYPSITGQEQHGDR